MRALPRLRRRDADTTSYVADYLTRSVRRARLSPSSAIRRLAQERACGKGGPSRPCSVGFSGSAQKPAELHSCICLNSDGPEPTDLHRPKTFFVGCHVILVLANQIQILAGSQLKKVFGHP